MSERCDFPDPKELEYKNLTSGKKRTLKGLCRINPDDLVEIPALKRVELKNHLIASVYTDLVDLGQMNEARLIVKDNIEKKTIRKKYGKRKARR